MKELVQGLKAWRDKSLDAGAERMTGPAARVTQEMRLSRAHGDQTGASHSNYTAYVVGRGRTGAAELAAARGAALALNPAHVAPVEQVEIGGELGVILTDNMDYAEARETENAGQKAVLGPTLEAEALTFTQAFAICASRARR